MKLTRRSLLGGIGVGAAACAPAVLFGASWRRGTEKIILGEGAHRYEWIPNWAKLPEGKSFSSTHGGVQTDAKDNVYVTTDNKNHSMHVFDSEGNHLKSWDNKIAGGSVHGIQIVKEGDKEVMLVAHTGRHKVYKTDLDGNVLMELAWPQESGVLKKEGQYKPTMVAQAPNGDLYVADGYGSNYVYRFDKEGKFLHCWNSSKTEAGRFKTPHGVWIDTRGDAPIVMVSDRANGRLVNFTPEGKLIGVVITGLKMPCKVSIRHGNVLIPELRGGVVILDKDNKKVAGFGINKSGQVGNFKAPVDTWKDGEFTAPHGACWDSKGDLYVEDWNQTGRVTKLKHVTA